MTARSGGVSLPKDQLPGGLSRTKWVAQRRYDKFYMDSGGYIYTFFTHRCTCTHVTTINKEEPINSSASLKWGHMEGTEKM